MNYKEFASKIKLKYPDYGDMDDKELAQKMVAKFPDYSDVTFDDADSVEPVQSVTEPEKKDRNMFGLPDNVEKAIFPTSGTQTTGKRESGFGGSLKQGAMGALDILSLPARALGSLRTNPETGKKYNISDVESNLFRPEINKIKSKIDTMEVPQLTTNKPGSAPSFNPMGSFALTSKDNNKEILKGATELAGGLVGDPTVYAGGVAKIAGKIGTAGNKSLGKLAQELSGVSEETLRKVGTGFGKGAKELKNAAGTQKQIGEKLLDALDDFDQYLPEKQVVDKALQNMPDIDVSNVINTLEKAKSTGMLSGAKQINSEIASLQDEIINLADPNGMIPAQKYVDLRREIDKVIGDNFGKSTNDFLLAAKKARYQMADDLVKTAEQSGVPEYATAMKSMSDKLRLVDELKGYVGKSAQVRDRKIETFMGTLFGKNKADRQRVVSGLGEIFGEDFLKESKLASMAAELGEEGVAGLLPRQFTGRSTLGPMIAGGSLAAGAGPASLVPLALSSPRIAAGSLASLDALGTGLKEAGKFAKPALKTVKKLPGLSAATQNLYLKNTNERARK